MDRQVKGPRSRYLVTKIDPAKKIVWLVDLDGAKAITNDAERVAAEIDRAYPDYRIIYLDTEKKWTELVHVGGVFNHYRSATGEGILL